MTPEEAMKALLKGDVVGTGDNRLIKLEDGKLWIKQPDSSEYEPYDVLMCCKYIAGTESLYTMSFTEAVEAMQNDDERVMRMCDPSHYYEINCYHGPWEFFRHDMNTYASERATFGLDAVCDKWKVY